MSKGSIFWGKSRGKLGEMVLSVIKGQQVQRAYNGQPTNPRTNIQTAQRIKFGNAVKFYKHAVQNFFKFAYEDRKQQESDYNAFMRHNAGVAPYVNRDDYNNSNYPSVAPYFLSVGTLASPIIETRSENVLRVAISPVAGVEQFTTIGQLSQALIVKYGLANGDIVTLPIIRTNLNWGIVAEQEELVSPAWTINQLILDTTSEALLSTFGLSVDIVEGGDPILKMDMYGLAHGGDDGIAGSAIVFSRKTPAGLLVSTSRIVLNAEGEEFYKDFTDTTSSAYEQALISWGATGEAILEGALVQ